MPDADRPTEVVLCPEDLEEIARFKQWIGIEASRRAGGDAGVCDALEAALYPEGVGRVPSEPVRA